MTEAQVAPRIESARREDDLIYDVGMHEGEDSDFYLRKGFRVVGFEADPDLVQRCRNRFSREIVDGRLTIVEGAIVEKTAEVEGQGVRFYRNRGNSLWGTVRGDWARRNDALGSPSSAIEVMPVDFASCLGQYGVPYYLKIDIEGSDAACLRALAQFEHKPDYVSIESEKVSFTKLVGEFLLLRKLGYTAFKAVQQEGISSQAEPPECREGSYVDYKFQEGASGLFGEDLLGRWKSYYGILAEYRLIFLLYKLFGDSGMLNSGSFNYALRVAFQRRLHRVIPGWYDTHARHRSHVPKVSPALRVLGRGGC